MKRFSIVLVLLLTFKLALPQGDIVEFVKAGKEDAKVLFESYLNPYAMALGEGLNNGWFQTAEAHKFLGFDVSLNISAINIPGSDQFFDLGALNLTNSELVNDPNKGTLTPTAAGEMPASERPTLQAFREIDGQRENLFTYQVPDGAGLDMIPVPMAQISFGLIPHTDLVARYVPELEFDNDGDNVKVGLKGIGIKHSFKEWIPLFKKLPFDAAVFFTYAKIDAETSLAFSSADYGNISVPSGVMVRDEYSDEFGYGVPDPNQRLSFDTKAMKYGLMLSKKIGILTLFGSVANSETKTNLDLLGKYPVIEENVSAGEVVVESLENPLLLDFESSSTVAMNAGLRLKLAFFKLFASVNKAEYTSYNAGIALGVR